MRLVAGFVALAGGLWLAAVQQGWIAGAVLLATAAFAWLWTRAFVAARRRIADPSRFYLELGASELVLAEGEDVQSVPWRSVERVEVDQDSLVVIVTCRDGQRLRIEPRYRGIGLQELGEVIHRAHREANPGCAEPNHD